MTSVNELIVIGQHLLPKQQNLSYYGAMTKVMPQNQIEEKLRWIKPLIEGESSIGEIGKFCPFSRKTIYNWLHAYQTQGELGLLAKSSRPHKSPNRISAELEDK